MGPKLIKKRDTPSGVYNEVSDAPHRQTEEVITQGRAIQNLVIPSTAEATQNLANEPENGAAHILPLSKAENLADGVENLAEEKKLAQKIEGQPEDRLKEDAKTDHTPDSFTPLRCEKDRLIIQGTPFSGKPVVEDIRKDLQSKANALQWPQECANCGGPVQKSDQLMVTTSIKGTGLIQSVVSVMIKGIPYCDRCYSKINNAKRIAFGQIVGTGAVGTALSIFLINDAIQHPSSMNLSRGGSVESVPCGIIIFLSFLIAYALCWLAGLILSKGLFKNKVAQPITCRLQDHPVKGARAIHMALSIPNKTYSARFFQLNTTPISGEGEKENQPFKDTPLKTPPQAPKPPAVLRLADPAHLARKQLDEITKIVDQMIRIEDFGTASLYTSSIDPLEVNKMLDYIDEGISQSHDIDLSVVKAGLLRAAQQFETATEVLDSVLSEAPEHFEARMWRNHLQTWKPALEFVGWDEQRTTLHPTMKALFERGTALQMIRDGLQKTLAIVAQGPASPLDNRTQVKTKWILSATPYGNIIAYYLRFMVPGCKPQDMEFFLIPLAVTEFSPTEGIFLMQQLAFTPYCFIVLASGDKVTFNHRITLGEREVNEIRDIVSRLNSPTFSAITRELAPKAVEWHMQHYDMNQLLFD